MNKLLLLFVFCICLFLDNNLKAQQSTSVVFLKHEMPTFAANNSNKFAMVALDYSLRLEKDRYYEAAKKKRNTGIGLTVAGLATLAGGVALLTDGSLRIKKAINFNNDDDAINIVKGYVEIVSGTLFTGGGIGMTIPGTILLSKGTKKMKEYKEQ